MNGTNEHELFESIGAIRGKSWQFVSHSKFLQSFPDQAGKVIGGQTPVKTYSISFRDRINL